MGEGENDMDIENKEKIEKIIEGCEILRLALPDGAFPYLVPVNYGHIKEDGGIIFYVHGSKKGRKVELIRKHGTCGFELEQTYGVIKKETACEHSFRFDSVIGTAKISIVDDDNEEEKKKGLGAIMKQLTGKGDWEYDEGYMKAVAIIKIEVIEMTYKHME